MALIKLLEDLINEHGSAKILKDRVDFFKEQLNKLESENIRLKEENDNLKKENIELINQIKKNNYEQLKSQQYIEHMGALFKRKQTGGFDKAVYCPSCKLAMFSLQDVLPFACSKCRTTVNFIGRDLPNILKEINEGYS